MLTAAHLRSVSAPADGACFYWSVLLLTTHDTLDDIDASTYLREPRPMQGISGESRRLMGNMRELRRQAVVWIQNHLTVLYDDPALTRTFPQYVAELLNTSRTNRNMESRRQWFAIQPCRCIHPPAMTAPCSRHDARCPTRSHVDPATALRLIDSPTTRDPSHPLHERRIRHAYNQLGPVITGSPAPEY